MNKPAALVVAFLLLSAGAGSAAVVTHALKGSNAVSSAVQHEKQLGPKPTPRWYWRWTQWRLGEGYAKNHALQPNLRPRHMPHRVPLWAWQRLHFFLLARDERALAVIRAGQKKHGHTTTTTTTTTTTPTTTTTETTTTPTPSSGGGSGNGVLMYGGHLTNLANPDLYSMVVGSAWTSDATSVVANAAGLGLVYFNGTVVKPTLDTGVTYTEASNNGWLLSCGTAICENGTYSTYGADLGSPSYQQAWISNVESYLAARPGIDGIFIDSVLYDPKGTFGTYPNKYPDTASWSAATLSFMQAVYSALHAKGYYVAVNAGAYISGNSGSDNANNEVTWWSELGPYTDGLMAEYYAEASNGTGQLRANGTAWYQHWDGWQRLIGVAQSFGDDFLGLEYNGATNTAAMTYGKASFLLEWNGGRSVFMYDDGSTDPTNSAWTQDIGTPVAAKEQVGVGWQRAYTGGTVLVNPSPSSSQTFTVNGTSYTLAPTTARILVS